MSNGSPFAIAEDLKKKHQDLVNEQIDSEFGAGFRDRAHAINETYSGSQVKQTGWDRFLNALGARSSYDKQMAQIEQARREAMLQLKTTEAEQDYNDPTSQAQRMRAAGQNPDLLGTEGVESASEFNEPESPSDMSFLTTGQDLFQGFGDALTTAMSLYSGIQGIKAAGIKIAQDEIELASKSEDSTLGLLSSLWSKSDFLDYFDSSGDSNGVKLFNFDKKKLRALGIRSKRGQKMFSQRVNTLMDSFKGDIFKNNLLKDTLQAQDERIEKQTSWYRANGHDDFNISSMLSEWNDFIHDVEKVQLSYSRDYYKQLSAGDQAGAQNAAAQFSKIVSSKKQELINRLLSDAKKADRNGEDSTFSLLLAMQLMGEIDVLGNSGIKGAAKFATSFIM